MIESITLVVTASLALVADRNFVLFLPVLLAVLPYFSEISQFPGNAFSAQVDVLPREADPGPVGGLRRFAVGQQPLVPGPQEPVLRVLLRYGGSGRIGAQGQGHRHPEAPGGVRMAGGVVQGGGVDLHHRPRRGPEGLHPGRIQLIPLPDLLLAGQQQDEVFFADVHFTVPVVLQTVQLPVTAPAHAQLDGHAAVSPVPQLGENIRFLQGGDAGLVGGAALRQGDGGHGLYKALRIIARQHLAVGLEFRVENRADMHDPFLFPSFSL